MVCFLFILGAICLISFEKPHKPHEENEDEDPSAAAKFFAILFVGIASILLAVRYVIVRFIND